MSRAAALLVVAFVAACTGAAPPANAPLAVIPVSEREPAPTVTGDLLGGGTYNLADHLGDVVVINFWGSWCAPCHAEADDLEGTYQSTRDSGVTFIGVNVRDAESKAKAFHDANATYPSIFDPSGRVVLNFEIPPAATPSTVIVDRQGRIAAVALTALLRDDLEPVVTEIASEPAP